MADETKQGETGVDYVSDQTKQAIEQRTATEIQQLTADFVRLFTQLKTAGASEVDLTAFAQTVAGLERRKNGGLHDGWDALSSQEGTNN